MREGRASYRNRYVESRGLIEERAAGRALYPGLLELKLTEAPTFKNTGNTNIVWHAGKLLALMEAALPTELAAGTLATLAEYDFGGRLPGPMTAHPKIDPETGEMLFFGYSPMPPYLQYHVADRRGVLVRSEVIDVAWPSMMHDFAITRDHVIFLLCPLVFSFENVADRGGVFSWEPERGTRLGIMPRSGGNEAVRWFDTDPCYVFHPMNAYTDGEEIVLDVARYGRLDFMTPQAARDPSYGGENEAHLHRWRIDLGAGRVRSATSRPAPRRRSTARCPTSATCADTTSSAGRPRCAGSVRRTASASRSSSPATRTPARTTATFSSSSTTTSGTRATSSSSTRPTSRASRWRACGSRIASPTASTGTGLRREATRRRPSPRYAPRRTAPGSVVVRLLPLRAIQRSSGVLHSTRNISLAVGRHRKVVDIRTVGALVHATVGPASLP